MKVYDIVIIGKNISAMTAAIYSGMSKTNTLYISCPNEVCEATGVNRYLGYRKGSYEDFHANTYEQLKKFDVEESKKDIEKILIENGVAKIYTDEEIIGRTLIVSTEDVFDKIEGNKNSEFLFKCGTISKDNIEESTEYKADMIMLAGTGCMAAMDARHFIAKEL